MPSDDGPPDVDTLDEVAEHLRRSRPKHYDLSQLGEIPCSKIAGRWRFYRSEIDEWMLAQRLGRRTRGGTFRVERTG